MSMLKIEGLTAGYGPVSVLHGLDLEVGEGELVVMLGANGAGKTTLIKMVLGLLRPTAGRVQLFGQPPGLEQRRRIGYVPQNLGLYTDLSVDENLAFRAEVFGCAQVGAGDLPGGRHVGDLPLGLQRRAAFAAALQHRPELLVLDEPTSGVSPLSRSELWDLIRSEADRGAGVLVSTHYMDEAVQADRLVVMARGRVVATGSEADVVGERRTLVVEAAHWEGAFAAVDGAGLRPLLAGRTIRVPGGEDDLPTLRQVLADAGVEADVRTAPATLEETLVELSR